MMMKDKSTSDGDFNMSENKWFNRYGQPVPEKFLSKIIVNKRGDSGKYYVVAPCRKCGGLGGHEMWAHTGWTCYRCGGATHKLSNGLFSDPAGADEYKVYTAEKLEKLNKAEEKRQQKKAEKFDAARTDFMIEYGDIIEAAEFYAQKNSFVKSVLDTVLSKNEMSSKQEEALIKAFTTTQGWINNENNLSNEFVGKFGERTTTILTLKFEKAFQGYYGPYYITTYEDKNGNRFTYKGSSPKGKKGETAEYTFTIKDHEEYNGKKSTVISRVKEKK